MSKKFPHLNGANDFPGVNARPFEQYENNFDYDSWTAITTLKPCNVRWGLDTGDRVKWSSDTERDDYFDSLDGNTYEMETLFDIVPETTVKLPIPFYSAQWANYLVVTVEQQPGTGDPLDNSERRIIHYHYFVIETTRTAGSTTAFTLVPDWWTTYINDVDIPRIMLERGHDAMTHTSVDSYLTNPLENTTGLLTPEPDAPTEPVKISSNDFVPFESGELYFCFALRCNWMQFTELRKAGETGSFTNPTYADTSARWGYQYEVNGYAWDGVQDVANITTPVATGHTNNEIRPNGYSIVAVKTSEYRSKNLFDEINKNYPQMFQLIEACFVVGESLINLGSTWDMDDIRFYSVNENRDSILKNIQLNKQMFDYPDEYADITKLYTNPYSFLEITDNNGTSSTIRIEDTTDELKINRKVSILYPYLNCRAFLTGLYGKNHSTYEWRTLNNVAHTSEIPDSGLATALMQYDIPTYTLFIDNTTAWNLENASSALEQARENALNSYHTSVRSMNTGYENTLDSSATEMTNTQNSNSTMLSNVNATNANSSSVQTRLNNLNVQIANYQNQMNTDNVIETNSLTKKTTTNTNVMAITVAQEDNQSNALTSMNAGIGAAISAGISVAGMTLAPETGGLSLGATAAITGAGTAVSQGVQAVNLGIAMSKNLTICDQQVEINNLNQSQTADTNLTLTGISNAFTTKTTNERNNVNSAITSGNNATTLANANRNSSTSNTNAGRSRDTSNANSLETRNSSLFSAKTTLEQTQKNTEANINDNKRGKAITIASNSGDPLPDIYSYRGIQVKVKTQPADIVKRCGDSFLRLGYTSHENVENPQLNEMKNFTYWEGEPTIYGKFVPSQAIAEIRNQFQTGVTVWRDADTIGASIYDNI